MKRTTWLLFAILPGAACAPLESPTLRDSGPVRSQLGPSLRPDASFLCPRFEGLDPDSTGDPNLRLRSLPRDDGSTFLLATGVNPPYLCAGVVAADFSVTELAVPQGFEQPREIFATMAVDTRKGAYVGFCEQSSPTSMSVAAIVWPQGSSSFVHVETAMPCTPTLATSADGQDWFSLQAVLDVPPGEVPEPDTPTVLRLQRYTLGAGSQPERVGDARDLETIDSAYGQVPWFDEPEAGVFAWIAVSSDRIDYRRSDRTTVVTTAWSTDLVGAWRDPATGYLWLSSSEGARVWDPDNDVLLAEMPLPPEPSGGGPWVLNPPRFAISVESIPNPEASWLNVPVAASLAVPGADAYVVQSVPTTPCGQRDACRAVGESYLAGAVGIGGRPLGIYYVWPWDQSYIVSEIVVAPLDVE